MEKFANINPGMTVAVDTKVEETTTKGDVRERIQTFEGVVLSRGGIGLGKTITVYKKSGGIGVERIFPLNMPSIADIRVLKETKVRRAKLRFLKKSNARQPKEKKISK